MSYFLKIRDSKDDVNNADMEFNTRIDALVYLIELYGAESFEDCMVDLWHGHNPIQLNPNVAISLIK